MGYVGTYDRTIFYNPSNKYCIISVKTSDQSVPQQARSAYRHRDNMIRFIAVGYELPQTDKVSMILDGEWENGKHGVQLQVDKKVPANDSIAHKGRTVLSALNYKLNALCNVALYHDTPYGETHKNQLQRYYTTIYCDCQVRKVYI